MSDPHTNPVIQLIDTLLGDPPKSPESVNDAMGVELAQVDTGNHDQEFRISVADRPISSVRLRKLNRANAKLSFLELAIQDDASPTRSEVFGHFGEASVSATPRGRSLKEEFQYTQTHDWGDAIFGFSARDPEHLSSMVFRMNDT